MWPSIMQWHTVVLPKSLIGPQWFFLGKAVGEKSYPNNRLNTFNVSVVMSVIYALQLQAKRKPGPNQSFSNLNPSAFKAFCLAFKKEQSTARKLLVF